jgi:hemerythrin-like domain-containing protein
MENSCSRLASPQRRLCKYFYTSYTSGETLDVLVIRINRDDILPRKNFCAQGAEMLTATYSLVAMSAEQKNARSILAKLQQHIHAIFQDLQGLNKSCIESALSKLQQFEEYCHRRKVEIYLIPAIRKATHDADGILLELEHLSKAAVDTLHSLQEQFHRALDQGVLEIQQVRQAAELYFHNLLKRLAKEEDELFPLVRHLLPIEQWFEIAAKLLSEDSRGKPNPSLLSFTATRPSPT